MLGLGGSYATVVLLMSDILIAVLMSSEDKNFSGLPRGFLIRTGALQSTMLLLIFCDTTLVVVLLHLLNAEAKLLIVLLFKTSANVRPQIFQNCN